MFFNRGSAPKTPYDYGGSVSEANKAIYGEPRIGSTKSTCKGDVVNPILGKGSRAIPKL